MPHHTALPPDQPGYFDAMFRQSDDPWGFKTRWYERRKRALTLASLPLERYDFGFEPGCANGELSAALASRCRRLLVSDGIDKAVELSRERLKDLQHVEVRRAWLPRDWPAEQFDLIVLSEFLFYLKPAVVEDIARRAQASLTTHGTLLACHWRNPITGCELTGDDAHAILERVVGLPKQSHILEPDLRLDVWAAGPSVAERDHLS